MFTRPLFLHFKRMIAYPWQNIPEVDYKVLLHGNHGDMTAAEAALLADFPDRVLDWRGQTDGSLPSAHYKNFEEFLASDAEILGIFDDDARFDYPLHSMAEVCRLYDMKDRLCFSGRPIGAMGPMSDFFWYHKHESDPDAAGEIDSNPWAFYGCQFYHRAAIEAIDWRTLLTKLKIWSDFSLMMEIHRKGFSLYEIHMEGYVHRGSKGTANDKDQWTAQQMKDMILQENEFLNEWFDGTIYQPFMNKMHATIIKKKLQPRIDRGE
jgi:hypothetical protein